MKKIKLTQGKYALVDDKDFSRISKHTWHYTSHGYAYKDDVSMHRFILNAPKGKQVDHKNMNGLDNQRKNLRICTNLENMRNYSKPQNNTSNFKGVSWHKRGKIWRAYIKLNYKQIHLGHFSDKLSAAKAYNKAATKYFREVNK